MKNYLRLKHENEIVSQEDILEGNDKNQIMICLIVENKLYEQDMLDIFIKSIMKRE